VGVGSSRANRPEFFGELQHHGRPLWYVTYHAAVTDAGALLFLPFWGFYEMSDKYLIALID